MTNYLLSPIPQCLWPPNLAGYWLNFKLPPINSSIQINNNLISVDRCNLIRADNSSHSKGAGVCIFYKKHIPVIKRDDFCTLDNCLGTEVRLQG